MASSVIDASSLEMAALRRETYKVTLVSGVGTLIDYFDISIAGFLAATVWPALFFPKGSFAAAFAGSIGVTLGVSALARPIGSVIFGHFGDKLGRKNALVATLILAAVGTISLALTPTYEAIGIWSVVIIILSRLIFGIAMGGEMGGAVSWITEVAAASKTKRRGLFAGLLATFGGIGTVASAGSLLAGTDLMSAADFSNWGWRVIVLLGAAAMIVAGIARYSVVESPLFAELKKKGGAIKEGFPIVKVLKERWPAVLILPWIAVAGTMVLAADTAFLGGYLAVTTHFFTFRFLYTAIVLAGLALILVGFLMAYLSDVIGRKRSLYISLVVAVLVTIVGLLVLFPSGNSNEVLLGATLLAIPVAGMGAFMPLYSESFPTRYRQTAAGFTYQMSNFYEAILFIYVIPVIYSTYGLPNSPLPVAVMCLILIGFAVIALLYARETRGALQPDQ